LLGPPSDLHQEDGLDARDRLRHAAGVIEIADGDLDAHREAGRPGRVAHQCPDAVAPLVQLPRERAADVACCSSDEIHVSSLPSSGD
jgi:hypothetical protein